MHPNSPLATGKKTDYFFAVNRGDNALYSILTRTTNLVSDTATYAALSYYSSNDQKNFLSPDGLYGHTWSEQAAKYHITFMISNDAPGGTYGTAERFKQASMFSGYNFAITDLKTNDKNTIARVTNTGIAPIYRDAFLAVGGVRSKSSLKGLCPGQERLVLVGRPTDGSDVTIESDYILPTQKIQFDADL